MKAKGTDEVLLHEDWALHTDPASIDVAGIMTGPNAVENRYLLGRAVRTFGSLAGLKILDVGAGLGESSVFFAKNGAMVTAMDLSPEMVNFIEKLARMHGVHNNICTHVGSIESLNADRYDVVYAANVLHHVSDKYSFVEAAAGCLRPGGLFLSYDPIESNPIIEIYRHLAHKVRSATEHPLRIDFAKVLCRSFESVEHREFWLFAQALFLKYYVVDHLDPSATRYWKRIFEAHDYFERRCVAVLHVIDRVPLSLPLIRRWAWNAAFVARKKEA